MFFKDNLSLKLDLLEGDKRTGFIKSLHQVILDDHESSDADDNLQTHRRSMLLKQTNVNDMVHDAYYKQLQKLIVKFNPGHLFSRNQFQKFHEWFQEQLNVILSKNDESSLNLGNGQMKEIEGQPDVMNKLEHFYNFTLKILIRQIGTHQFELGDMLSRIWALKNLYIGKLKECL